MSGVYSTAACFMTRLRQKQDGMHVCAREVHNSTRHTAWSGAAAGCVTGVALGWGTGAAACAQSCLMVGALTYVMEKLGTSAQACVVAAAPRLQSRRRLPRKAVSYSVLPLQHACSNAIGTCRY